MTDEELILGCRQKDRKSQRILYDKYVGLMYAICCRYAGDKSYAEDILQEGFSKVFAQINSFRNEGSFEGWLKRIFVHTAINFYHKNRNFHNLVDFTDELPAGLSDAVNALSKISEKELLDLIGSLPLGYRMVFNLNVIEGYDHEEIAGMLGIAAGTSRSQLVKARRMLQQKIKNLKIIAA